MIESLGGLKDLQALASVFNCIVNCSAQTLIYEKNIASRRVIEAVFARPPMVKAQTFTSGHELKRTLEKVECPCFVFYDLDADELTIEKFLLEVVPQKRKFKTWVIATVQLMDKERLVRLIPMGLTTLLAKPLHPDAVREKVTELAKFPNQFEMDAVMRQVEAWKI